MNIGIIIIFNNNEAQIKKHFFIEQINSFKTIELCLVDNNSKDKTLDVLEEIKEACPSHVSVVEIKKHSSKDAAKRAGARYMFNQFNLKHIGFVDVSTIHQNGNTLNELIESLCKHHKLMINTNTWVVENREVKQTFFKSIFSVVDYLKRIKTNTNFNNLNPSV